MRLYMHKHMWLHIILNICIYLLEGVVPTSRKVAGSRNRLRGVQTAARPRPTPACFLRQLRGWSTSGAQNAGSGTFVAGCHRARDCRHFLGPRVLCVTVVTFRAPAFLGPRVRSASLYYFYSGLLPIFRLRRLYVSNIHI